MSEAWVTPLESNPDVSIKYFEKIINILQTLCYIFHFNIFTYISY